jgi:hypothetical protein
VNSTWASWNLPENLQKPVISLARATRTALPGEQAVDPIDQLKIESTPQSHGVARDSAHGESLARAGDWLLVRTIRGSRGDAMLLDGSFPFDS